MNSSNSINKSPKKRFYTIGEEIASSITHGIGAALSIAALVILVVLAATRGDAWRVVSFSIYGTTLILLYMASTLYHAIQHKGAKQVFRILDHSFIYLLIAGTYTPFLLVPLRGGWGWSLFGLIWALAITGIVFKAIFINRMKKLSVVIYILMGWMIMIALKPLLAEIPKAGLWWLAGGGLSYTGGVVFYAMKSVKFSHAVWHLFVLGGSICHFFAILLYVLPLK
ncbi:hemolysin III family protein [candidate division KSB1 bacterium]|nr:hemolysin III family protein [candidate division KSB1 bacterium]